MVMGVDPQKMAQMQKVSQYIRGAIEIDYKEHTVIIALASDNPEAQKLIPELIGQFGTALAQQLSSFFSIKGEIIEKNKT